MAGGEAYQVMFASPDRKSIALNVYNMHCRIRLHFAKFVPALRQGDLEKAQLGLGHSYSRAKVKFNVNRVDNMIIQAISLLDQLDKDINTFSMRAKYGPGIILECIFLRVIVAHSAPGYI
jgi:RNA processing factor Prp31